MKTSDCEEKKFMIVPLIGVQDTAYLNPLADEYPNGIRVSKLFLNDSLWVDSIHCFHESGQLSLRYVNLGYEKKWDDNLKEYRFVPQILMISYYESGNIRSISEVIYNLGFTPIYVDTKSYFSSQGKLIYQGSTLNSKCIFGTLYEKKDEELNCDIYGVYKNGIKIESWYVQNQFSNKITILKVIDHKHEKEILKPRLLRKKVKISPVSSFSCDFFVHNVL